MVECPHCRNRLPAWPLIRDAHLGLITHLFSGGQAAAYIPPATFEHTMVCPICQAEFEATTFWPGTLAFLAGVTAAIAAAAVAVLKLDLHPFSTALLAIAVFFCVHSLVYLRLLRFHRKTP